MLSSTSNGVEYGLSLWSVEVSCHHSVPSLESGRSEGEKSHERKQRLFHSSQQRGVASTLSQPQMQRTAPQRLPGNEFNSIPARHSTISTPYSSPFIPRVMWDIKVSSVPLIHCFISIPYSNLSFYLFIFPEIASYLYFTYLYLTYTTYLIYYIYIYIYIHYNSYYIP